MEFTRIGRRTIVRMGAIQEVRKRNDGSRIVVPKGGMEMLCSKSYWTEALEQLL
jgi:hypothetical protein